jgi:hypothetical protein
MLGAPMTLRPERSSWEVLARSLALVLPACNAFLGIEPARETAGASGSSTGPSGQGALGGHPESTSGGTSQPADGGDSGAPGLLEVGGAGGGSTRPRSQAGAAGTTADGTVGKQGQPGGDGGASGQTGATSGPLGGAGGEVGGAAGKGAAPSTPGGATGAPGGAGATAGSAGAAPCPEDSCGWCGHACLGSACANGLCDVTDVDSAEQAGSRVVVGESDVIWSCYEQVRHARGDATAASGALLAGLGYTSDIVLEGLSYVAAVDASLVRGVVDGQAPPVSFYDGDFAIYALVSDQDDYFFSACDEWPDIQVLRLGKADSEPEVVLEREALKDYDCPTRLAVDSTHLWFVIAGEYNGVYRANRTDWTIETFWTLDADAAYAIILDEQYVYVSTANAVGEPDSILRRRKDGTGGVETLSRSEWLPTALLLHEGALYWANAGNIPGDGDNGEVKRLDLVAGASPRVLAVNQGWPRALAIDGDWIYWTGGLYKISGYVRRVAR